IGGYNNTAGDPLNTNYAFNQATNTYTQEATMPTRRWGAIAVAVNNEVYVFGGDNASGAITANEMYDPATNIWTTKAPLPAAIGHQGISGCTDGTNVYLVYESS